jgi:CheY-like chemotaxis protein
MAKTLLLADDSVTIQRVVELTFAHEDVRIISVSDGERAMQWLETDRADLVLVDVGIPEVDGYTIAEHVKTSKRHKNVPVLLMAGAFEPVDEDRSRAIGCDGVIVKPFEPQHLVERVKELLGQSSGNAAAAVKAAQEQRDQRDPMEEAGVPDRRKPTAPAGLKKVMTMPSSGPSVEELRRETAPKTTTMPAAEPPPPLPPIEARPAFQPVEPPPAPVELELPARPLWDMTPNPAAKAPEPAAPPPAPATPATPRVTLVNAFTALLAAEKSSAPAKPAGPVEAADVSAASIEQAVRRVLAGMTEDLVRRIVLETAERLIREEIEKIKANPE